MSTIQKNGVSAIFYVQTTLFFVAGLWWMCVMINVPKPYLDEVFHVRQAENYAQGHWNVWDPKITTPPGLYILPAILSFLDSGSAEGLAYYRAWNFMAILSLFYTILRLLHCGGLFLESYRDVQVRRMAHHTLNMCLFPPLFFFFALFYTDVWSTVSVLFLYMCYQERKSPAAVVITGLLSLLFRQTNIFWVSVFLGGLSVRDALQEEARKLLTPERRLQRDSPKNFSWLSLEAYKDLGEFLNEQPIGQASFEDYIKCLLSYALNAYANLRFTVWTLSPYIVILVVFVGFVTWNGGVVLGDKDNHTASIHLAQMLYIWPNFAFFSWPFLLIPLMNLALPLRLQGATPLSIQPQVRRPRLLITISTILVMIGIVRYNTIVHPFTLADNRHYVFYVFRLLLRHPATKFLVVPVYFVSAWCVLHALGHPGKQIMAKDVGQFNPKVIEKGTTSATECTSSVLIWLLATTLSLCTAPLVEPRYLIMPWLVWRLNIALQRGLAYDYKVELWLETIWFLLINAFTGYIFLFWGFEWPQEPGKIQRFMW